MPPFPMIKIRTRIKFTTPCVQTYREIRISLGSNPGRDHVEGKSAIARFGADCEETLERGETDAQSRERPRSSADQEGVNISDLQFFFSEEPVDCREKVLSVFHVAFDGRVAELGPALLDRNAQDGTGGLNS